MNNDISKGWKIFIYSVIAFALATILFGFSKIGFAQTQGYMECPLVAAQSGTVYGYGSSARNVSSGTVNADTLMLYWNGVNQNHRVFLTFNTSVLGARAVIDSAKISLNMRSGDASPANKYQFVQTTFTGELSYTTYNAFTGWALSGIYTVTAYSDSTGTTEPPATVDVKLNEDGINAIRTGPQQVTRFAGLLTHDINDALGPGNFGWGASKTDTVLKVWYTRTPDEGTRTTPYNIYDTALWREGDNVPVWKP